MEKAEIRCKYCNELLEDMISQNKHICTGTRTNWRKSKPNSSVSDRRKDGN